MDALRRMSIVSRRPSQRRRPKKLAAGQKEMLLPIAGKKPGKKTPAKKPATRQRKFGVARRERGARLGLFRWEFGNRQCELPRQRAR